jgi:hypothetical protein
MLNRLKLIVSIFAMLSLASILHASDVLYTSAAAFSAVTTGSESITFTATCSTCFTDYTSYTDAATGTVFSIATPFINLTGKDFYGTGTYPEDFLIESSTAFAVANLLTVTPPGGFSAISFDLGSFNGGPFLVTLSDGTTFTISPPGFGALSFFGFTSTSGISSISFATPANDTFVIDQASIADVTPEPAPLMLLATGLLALVVALKVKRSAHR